MDLKRLAYLRSALHCIKMAAWVLSKLIKSNYPIWKDSTNWKEPLCIKWRFFNEMFNWLYIAWKLCCGVFVLRMNKHFAHVKLSSFIFFLRADLETAVQLELALFYHMQVVEWLHFIEYYLAASEFFLNKVVWEFHECHFWDIVQERDLSNYVDSLVHPLLVVNLNDLEIISLQNCHVRFI